MIVLGVPGVNGKVIGMLSNAGLNLLEPLLSPGCSNLREMISSWRRCTLNGGPPLSWRRASMRVEVNTRGLDSRMECSRP